MANIYPDKASVEPFGTSRFRTFIGPITLSIKTDTVDSDTSITDNFPNGLTADNLVGAILVENGKRRIIIAAEDSDDAIKFVYHNGTTNVTMLYSKEYCRVFASAEDIAAYDDLEDLTVDVEIDQDEDLFGKKMADLQDNLEIEGNAITGTLLYIDDYSSAGFVGDESSGNFMVVHCSVPEVDGVTIKVKLNNVSTLDADGIVVCRIADKNAQKFTVMASKAGCKSVTKVFDLSGLVCEGPSENGEI